MDFNTDKTIAFIDAHEFRLDIISMYRSPPRCGFKWATGKDWDTVEKGKAFIIMKRFILEEGYDSSAFTMMQRAVAQVLSDREFPRP